MASNKSLGLIINEEIINLLEIEFESSSFNKLPVKYGGGNIFNNPLIGISKGDDPIFQKYKTMVGPNHLTPLEMWMSCDQEPMESSDIRVLSIVFPFSDQIRKEGIKTIKSRRITLPAEIYTVARNYGNEFKKYIITRLSDYFKEKGYNAANSTQSNAYSIILKGQFYTTWSERYMAFASGLGSLGLHEGIITEVGCNVRLGSVITNAPLEITQRKSDEPYANCLFYMKTTCKECAKQCPANAISEKGFDEVKCNKYRMKVARKVEPSLSLILKPDSRMVNWKLKKDIFITGCELCQFGVQCTDKNPMVSHHLDFF